MVSGEFQPGSQAPHDGLYQELNVFGVPTGKMEFMTEGEKFPGAPRGFTWRPLSQLTVAELRAKAAEYRRMAATATTELVMANLLKLAERIDTLADRRERPDQSAS